METVDSFLADALWCGDFERARLRLEREPALAAKNLLTACVTEDPSSAVIEGPDFPPNTV